jgi:CRISPR-associated protein Cas1
MKSLERTKRDHPMRVDIDLLDASVKQMKDSIVLISKAESRDQLMGLEGEAAQAYFRAFPQLILKNEEYFIFKGRNRRPPLDPVNAMLSFAYTLLGNEIAGALETVGLDPSVGFLHTLRPGRYSLALDILEELRAPFADRFVLNMINLGQVTYRDFERKENGAFYLNDNARKNFLAAWQKKKQEIITHPYLKEKIAWGIVPYAQAMLLARYVRGDLDAYPPFLWR